MFLGGKKTKGFLMFLGGKKTKGFFMFLGGKKKGTPGSNGLKKLLMPVLFSPCSCNNIKN